MLSQNRRLLNFTYKMFNPADGSWGIVGEDYSWGGLAGHVAYGYRGTDIAICDIYNTYNWNKIFKPTTDFDRDIIQGSPIIFQIEKEISAFLMLINLCMYLRQKEAKNHYLRENVYKILLLKVFLTCAA